MKVEVLTTCFVGRVVFAPGKGRSGIFETLERYQIAHGGKRVVQNDVHVATMNLRYEIPPVLNEPMMVVQKCEI